MSEFSDYLEQMIRDRNMTASEMARYLGVDKSIMYKILKGSRMPSSLHTVNAMADYLRLTINEKAAFLDYYRMSLIGRDTFYRRAAVSEFIKAPLNARTVELPEGMVFEAPKEDTETCKTLYSRKAVLYRMIQEMVREAEMGEKSEMFLLTNQMDNAVFRTVEFVMAGYPNLKVNHILTFRTSSFSVKEEKNYNLQLLKTVLNMRSASEAYHADYLYDTEAGSKAPLVPFSNYLITSTHAIMFSPSADHAIVSNDQSICEMYRTFYEHAKMNSRPVFYSETDFMSHVSGVTHVPQTDREFTTIFCTRAIMNYFMTPEAIRKSIQKNSSVTEEQIRELEAFTNTGMEAITSRRVRIILSYDSLRFFMETGALSILPKYMFREVDEGCRIRVMKRFLVNANNIDFLLLKDDVGSISNDLVLEMSYRKAMLSYSIQNDKQIRVVITEPGLCESLMDYMVGVEKDPEAVYTKEEAIEKIRKLIDEFDH